MTDAKKDSPQEVSKGKKIAKSIRRHLMNYIFIAIAGSIGVMLISALAKAYRVKSPIDKAIAYLAADRSDDLHDQLERSARWEELYPSLKPRRDVLAIKCLARKGELGKAMGIADAMATTSFQQQSPIDFIQGFVPPESVETTVDRFSYFINHMEIPIAVVVDRIFRKQNTALLIDRWSGYNDLATELKSKGDNAAIVRLHSTAKTHHPDSKFTKALTKYVEEAKRLGAKGQKMPRPDQREDAPFGWAMVNREQISAYNSTGEFLRKVTAGTIVEVDEIRNSKSGNIVMGSLRFRNGETPGVVLLAKDLSLKRGLLFEVDEAILKKLYARAELTQKIAEANASAKERRLKSNPHYAEYLKVSKEYTALRKTADRIMAQFKATTGAEREKHADALRTLKNKKVILSNKLKSAKATHDDWARANAHKTATGSESTNLKNQLNELEAELTQLGYL